MRQDAFQRLCRDNPAVPRHDVLSCAEKLLDRVLFCAFCEDRGLLPTDTIRKAYEHRDPYHPRPIWESFHGLFSAINRGNAALGIHAYNGGLFADDPVLDGLKVADEVCAYFRELGDFDYRSPHQAAAYAPESGNNSLIDVDILGHIFEQSITDLEKLRNEIELPSPVIAKGAAAEGDLLPSPVLGRGAGGDGALVPSRTGRRAGPEGDLLPSPSGRYLAGATRFFQHLRTGNVLVRPGVVTRVLVRTRAAQIRLHKLWIQPNGLTEVRNRLVVLALRIPCNATTKVDVGKIGIELKSLVVVGEGLVMLALMVPDNTTIMVGFAIIRFEPERFVEIGDGLLVLALGIPSDAPIVVDGGVIGTDF